MINLCIICFILLYVDKKALCNKKSGWADSNRRPPVPQTDTLTTALHPETTYSCLFAPLCQPHGKSYMDM